jgi:DNA adenine methylase
LCAAVEPLTLEFYNACEACPDNDPDEVRRALRFLVVNKGGFNGYIKRGTPPVGGRAQRGKWLVDWCWKPEKVRAHVAELGRLLAGRLKCERLSVFDSPWLDQSAAIYLDPPYVTAGPKMYGEYGSFDHERLRDRLRTVRGEWVLSYDDHPSIRSLYMGFRVEGEDVISSRGLSAGKLKTKGEVLVRSPILDSAHRTEALLNQIPDSEAAWTW